MCPLPQGNIKKMLCVILFQWSYVVSSLVDLHNLITTHLMKVTQIEPHSLFKVIYFFSSHPLVGKRGYTILKQKNEKDFFYQHLGQNNLGYIFLNLFASFYHLLPPVHILLPLQKYSLEKQQKMISTKISPHLRLELECVCINKL